MNRCIVYFYWIVPMKNRWPWMAPTFGKGSGIRGYCDITRQDFYFMLSWQLEICSESVPWRRVRMSFCTSWRHGDENPGHNFSLHSTDTREKTGGRWWDGVGLLRNCVGKLYSEHWAINVKTKTETFSGGCRFLRLCAKIRGRQTINWLNVRLLQKLWSWRSRCLIENPPKSATDTDYT